MDDDDAIMEWMRDVWSLGVAGMIDDDTDDDDDR